MSFLPSHSEPEALSCIGAARHHESVVSRALDGTKQDALGEVGCAAVRSTTDGGL